MGTYKGNGSNGRGPGAFEIHDQADLGLNRELQNAEIDIERMRERLSSSLHGLRSEIKSLADWRHWVSQSPAAFVVGAFGLGLLLGVGHAAQHR